MQEAWSFLGGAMTGFAFAVFLGWCWSYREKMRARKPVDVNAVIKAPIVSQDYTVTHTDKRVFLTFAAPDGYHYEDTKGRAIILALHDLNYEQDEAAA